MSRVAIKSTEMILLMNLADVPHGDLIGSKDYPDGRHIDFYEAAPGTQVIVYDEETGEPKWADVSGWSEHRGSPIELVKLSNGDVISTDDDPRAVYGIPIDAKNLELSRATPSDAYFRKFIVPIVDNLPELSPICASIDMQGFGVPTDEHPCIEDLIFYADYDLGQFIGLMAGDGWWDKKAYRGEGSWKFYISDLEGYNAAFIESWLRRYFSSVTVSKHAYGKDEYPDRFGDTVRYSFGFPAAHDFCRSFKFLLGGKGDETTAGSANKRLPVWVMSFPEDFRRGLLNGLIATDGSISLNHSGKRKHEELMIQFGSTSRRLVDDVKALCSSLGIRASVFFGKVSSGGKDFWGVSLSSVDCKSKNIFANCCHTRKREIFLAAEVSDSASNDRGDFLPLPREVSDHLGMFIKARGGIAKVVVENCPLPAYVKRGNSLYQSLYQYKDKGYITRDFANRFIAYQEDGIKLTLWFNDYIKQFRKRLMDGERSFPLEEVNTLVEGIAYNSRYFIPDDVRSVRALAGRLRQKGTTFPSNLFILLESVILKDNAYPYSSADKDDVIKKWLWLAASKIRWAYIEEVEKTGKDEVGYDLTVPGYETFTSDTGVVLSNTMTYYVPVSQAAVDEAYRLMLPSKNQLSARDFTALPELQEELVSGAYLASHKKNKPPVAVFNTKAEALDAYRHNRIPIDANVIIKES